MGGGGLSSTTTSVQHPLGWCDGSHRTTAPVRSPHTATGGEEREIEPIKWMGIIRRPWLTRASGGNVVRTPRLHPYSYDECHVIFNDHRESGPRFNVSSERRCFLQYSVPRHYTGALGPTQTTGWAPPAASLTPLQQQNLVFPRRSPNPGTDQLRPCFSFSGQPVWAAGWYGCGNLV